MAYLIRLSMMKIFDEPHSYFDKTLFVALSSLQILSMLGIIIKGLDEIIFKFI